jgi:hypothetical protein
MQRRSDEQGAGKFTSTRLEKVGFFVLGLLAGQPLSYAFMLRFLFVQPFSFSFIILAYIAGASITAIVGQLKGKAWLVVGTIVASVGFWVLFLVGGILAIAGGN